jgi:DNA modification methylase
MLTVLCGDALEQLRTLPDASVQCCVTSPPYWGLRDYGALGQLGLEKTPEEYVAKLVDVMREVRRVLKSDGTMFLNLGDSYAGGGRGTNVGSLVEDTPCPPGYKRKDLVGIPWMVAFALRADGWWLRQDIIWHKPNPMPESVTDRCTKAHEYIFLLTKSGRYYFDADAIREDGIYPAGTMAAKGSVTRTKTPFINGRPPEYKEYNGFRNKRDVWTVTTAPYPEAHFATFPPALIKPCILAGSKPGDQILDPFAGSGTTGMVALKEGRDAILIELNPSYVSLIHKRCSNFTPELPFALKSS